MSTFLLVLLIIHAVIGVFVGLFMFGLTNSQHKGLRLVAEFFMYMGIGQVWLPFVIYVNS